MGTDPAAARPPLARRASAALLALSLASAVACGGNGADDAEDRPTTTSTERDRAAAPDEPTSTSTTAVDPAAAPEAATARSGAAPDFAAVVEPVTAEQLHASWRPGCPHPVEALRLVRARHWGFDGAVHDGSIVVDAAVADAVVRVLGDLFSARYPIERMEPVDRYGGSDDASMAANNTSAFNCRPATGSSGWSEHAFGRAIDLNPLQNPYVRGDLVLPAQSARYLDRTSTDPGVIHDGDAAVTAFAREGWRWGGHWSSLKDYQHFSPSGR